MPEDLYQVKEIVGKRIRNGVTQYEIVWENWDGANTFEPEENIVDKDLIREFEEKQKEKGKQKPFTSKAAKTPEQTSSRGVKTPQLELKIRGSKTPGSSSKKGTATKTPDRLNDTSSAKTPGSSSKALNSTSSTKTPVSSSKALNGTSSTKTPGSSSNTNGTSKTPSSGKENGRAHKRCSEERPPMLSNGSEKKLKRYSGSSRKSLVPVEVDSATMIQGELVFRLKYSDDSTELIKAKKANVKYPKLVIQFYEKRITWNSEN